MRNLILIIAMMLFGGFHALARDVALPSSQVLSSRPGKVAILRGLDKVTATTHDFEAPIDQPVKFGSLEITASYCRKRPPEETPEVYAFLIIKDRKLDGGGNEIGKKAIFNGWMFASSPALNALQHPVYDVWVLDCK